jgi:hypothetical protein
LSGIPAVFAVMAITFSIACGETVIDVSKLVGDPLSPDTHKAEIAAIDAIVFEDGPIGAPERAELVHRLTVLSKVAQADPANTIAVNIGQNMKRFAAGVERTPVGTVRLNSTMRQQWMRFRGGLFSDASWFRWSSADPIER